MQRHQTGRQRRRNVPSKGSPAPKTPQQMQSASSSRQSAPPPNTPPSSGKNKSTADVEPGVTASHKVDRPTAAAYCATTLLGDTCVDSRCSDSHDISRCEPCGRSFPASLFEGHMNANSHLEKVASKTPTTPSTLRIPPPSEPILPTPEPTPISTTPRITSPPPRSDLPILQMDPRVTVSHEDGLDFVAEGTGTVADPSFPSISHVMSIEGTNVESTLFVRSVTLIPFLSPWFSASLIGTKATVRPQKPRKIDVTFNAPQAGTFRAVLRITFSDQARPDEQEFVITRDLRGGAILPSSPAGDGGAPKTVEDRTRSEDTEVMISDDLGLAFTVNCRSDAPFPTQTKQLVITRSLTTSLISFTAAKVLSPDGSVTGPFSAEFEGHSKRIVPQQSHIVTVSFSPQREGLYEATLELTFYDYTRGADFMIKRTLSGLAKRPTGGQERHKDGPARNPESQSTKDCADDHAAVTANEKQGPLDSIGTGISVSHGDGLDFGIVERKNSTEYFAAPSLLLIIKHAGGHPPVTFVRDRTRTLDGGDPDFLAVFEGDSHIIRPGTESTIRVIFSPQSEGQFKATLELCFYDSKRSDWIIIRRGLQGVASSLASRSLDEEADDNDKVTEGSREVPPRKGVLLKSPDRHRRSRNFPDYKVPPVVQEAVDRSTAECPYDKLAPDLVSTLRPDELSLRTYARYFKALLNIEDGHQQWDVLDQPPYLVNVQPEGTRKRYSVEIENDDEDLLPEVVQGNFLWLVDTQDDKRYEARVMHADVFMRRHLAVLKISLMLPTNFNLYQGAQFVLRLRHDRIALRRQYHALTAVFTPRRLLFPSVSDIKPIQHLSKDEVTDLKLHQLVNRKIRDDDQQLQTVVSILEQPPGSVPFLIYGPAGTGKTSIVVESIVQLLRRDVGVKILACTPGDPAAGVLVEHLLAAGLDSDSLYHLEASSQYEYEDTSEDAQTSSPIPKRAKLLAFRLIVSTCSSASILQTLDVPVGHFSHIVIDDAMQVEEPLAMIPIMTFSDACTNVILAGDPNQLGPAIMSPTAAKAGLGKSYLERLMLMHEVYGSDTQVGKTIVGLQRNHRSHGTIIAWSNRYFYEDFLREYGNAYITYHLVHSNVLSKKGFPVVFHGVDGSEQHPKRSPLHHNTPEAWIVRNYCVKLAEDPERNIYPEEIGVIAPCKSQVRAIRRILKFARLSDISVGTVEEFQGRERKVIILAATRSNESQPQKASGFLGNHQHINVAVTRAQALLIVIGNPDVLGEDEHWRTFLNYVKSRNGWKGKMHSWKLEEVVQMAGYEVVPRKGKVVYGEEFIGGKSEKIYRLRKTTG